MHRVWFRALLSGLFCLCIGLVAFSCQWLSSGEKVEPDSAKQVKQTTEPAPQITVNTASTLESIVREGELKVGLNVGYVPFEMLGSGGSVVGFDVDMAAMIAHDLGVGLRIVRQEWPDLIPSLDQGKIHIIMSAMTITPKRNLSVMFTLPVIETGRMFLVHQKNGSSLTRFKDLNNPGIFVVSRAGGLGSISLQRDLPLAAFREFKDEPSALDEVIEGRAQAYVDDEFVIRLACAKHPDKLISRFQAVTYEPMAWAVRPGDAHWLNWLNNFIGIIQHDGRLNELKKKWLRDYFLDLGASSK